RSRHSGVAECRQGWGGPGCFGSPREDDPARRKLHSIGSPIGHFAVEPATPGLCQLAWSLLTPRSQPKSPCWPAESFLVSSPYNSMLQVRLLTIGLQGLFSLRH